MSENMLRIRHALQRIGAIPQNNKDTRSGQYERVL